MFYSQSTLLVHNFLDGVKDSYERLVVLEQINRRENTFDRKNFYIIYKFPNFT